MQKSKTTTTEVLHVGAKEQLETIQALVKKIKDSTVLSRVIWMLFEDDCTLDQRAERIGENIHIGMGNTANIAFIIKTLMTLNNDLALATLERLRQPMKKPHLLSGAVFQGCLIGVLEGVLEVPTENRPLRLAILSFLGAMLVFKVSGPSEPASSHLLHFEDGGGTFSNLAPKLLMREAELVRGLRLMVRGFAGVTDSDVAFDELPGITKVIIVELSEKTTKSLSMVERLDRDLEWQSVREKALEAVNQAIKYPAKSLATPKLVEGASFP